MFRHILVATDGSRHALPAVRQAVMLARSLGARLTGITVVAAYAPATTALSALRGFPAAARREAQRALKDLYDEARAAKVRVTAATVTGGEPWKAILLAARSRKCDLIVMGSHGRKGLAGVLLGSEVAKVLTRSSTPVLVCR